MNCNPELYEKWTELEKTSKQKKTRKQKNKQTAAMNYNALFNSANYNDCLIRSAPGIGGNRSRRSSNRSFDGRQDKGM